MTIILMFAALIIGVLIGSVGVGGLLLPSALTMLADIPIHQSMATSLFTFIFTGIAGTIYYQKKGSIDWALARPVCLGALIAAFLGAWLNSKLGTGSLSLILAALIIFVGFYTLRASSVESLILFDDNPRRRWTLLLGIGATAGFASGLTGVGGPALSVPLMVLCGFPAIVSIGVGQVLQIVGALSGTLGNIRFGTINFGLAALLTVFEICGVVIGAYIIHRIDPRFVKKFIGVLCIVAGAAFMLRSLTAYTGT